ncbi:MAG: Do family serine endopeptidase [Candidatus Aminicenantes bacterium]|nr:Do family serine endopeptidase [Candidatus Aminicenantes bacterium]
MKKIGLIAGVSFLAGAIFFALSFGFLQKSTGQKPILDTPVVQAEAAPVTGLETINFAPVVKKVKPAVVKVTSESMRENRFGDGFFDQFFNIPQRKERVPGIGSGFLISSDGYIITNNHVVANAIKVSITTLDDKEYKAKIIGTDPKTDLALLKIKADNLPYIELGDSNKIEVGEWVLAIGNPLGQDLTVTAGIISAKGRQLGLADYEDFLQTDAAINMGNSGGPLINMDGKVVGINSAILAPAGGNVGIGFAIPSSLARKVIDDLKNKGRVVRGYLGISINAISQKEAEDLDFPTGGVLVSKIEKGSASEKAGLQKWDMIVGVNGEPVKKADELSTRIAELNPGDKVVLDIYRKTAKMTITVIAGEAPESEVFKTRGEEDKTVDLGMILIDNSPSVAREYGLKTSQGIVVKQVERGSLAQQNGIRPQDVILEVNRRELRNVADFRNIIAGKKPGSMLMLYVNRDGDEGFVRFVLPE